MTHPSERGVDAAQNSDHSVTTYTSTGANTSGGGTFVPTRVPADRPGRAGGKRDQNRIQRTDDLCRAALALALDGGLDALGIEAVSTSASLSKAAFYRYFSQMPELVEALFSPLVDGLRPVFARAHVQLATAADRDALMAAYDELVGGLVTQLLPWTDLLRLYLQERHGPATALRRPIHALADLVHRETFRLTWVVRDSPALPPDHLLRAHPPEVSALLVLGAAHELVAAVLAGRLETPPLAAASSLVELLVGGGVPTPAPESARSHEPAPERNA